ncbi:MAG: relaxase domain-containing protein [Candidatus Binatus sp.]
MLVMSRGALSAGQAETYYEEKYSQDDYYTEEHRVAGQWFGQGADAHRRAVSTALTELEHYALSRQKGGSEWVLTRNIVAACFDHIAARPAKGADDGYGVPIRTSTPTS